MKKNLLLKFTICFFAFCLTGFLLISLLGDWYVDRIVTQNQISALHDIASSLTDAYPNAIADADPVNGNTEVLTQYLDTCAVLSHCEIWLLDTSGNQQYSSTGHTYTEAISFDPTDSTGGYYMLGDFYGYMPEHTITVFAPLTSYYKTTGYLLLHKTHDRLTPAINQSLNVAYQTLFLLCVLSLLFPIMFRILVNRPLNKIITAARQYAEGNLNYQSHVKTNDEMEYLNDTLTDMATRLNTTAEDQQKFIANVSHDFRSPLTSIKGYLEAMEDGTIPTELYSKYIHIVLDETDRLNKLTQRLLTLNGFDTRGTYLNWESFELNGVIKKILATFEGRCIEKKITFEFTYSARQIYVYADLDKIQQVLYNLIDNAIKFSKPDSVIAIDTLTRGEKVHVTIKDHGCGIAKENLNKIWERFYKTDSSRGRDRKGTGLGLSIVREIITAHKEHIDVISTVGVGTQFTFTLPTAHDKEKQDA